MNHINEPPMLHWLTYGLKDYAMLLPAKDPPHQKFEDQGNHIAYSLYTIDHKQATLILPLSY